MLDNLTYEEKLEYLSLLEERERQKEYNLKYNKLAGFTPYDWQSDFMAASKLFKQRYLRAGNRCGKSLTEAYEFAQHITGQYQDWYEGERIPKSGETFWCIGVDLDSTSDVMQKELFGTKDIRFLDEIGTGSIPRDSIDFDSMTKDGRRLVQCRIKHKDGGYNLIRFYGAAQGQDKLMGQSVKYVWIDEESPHNSQEIYSQCVTRTLETKGFVVLTATPEQGRTPLNIQFEENKSNNLYLQQVSWDDCPHIDDDMRKEMLAGIPESQHQMRMLGLPVIGKGAVFDFTDSAISSDKPMIDNWDDVLFSLDIGDVNDPTVLSLIVDKSASINDEDDLPQYYIYDQWVLGDEDEINKRSPEFVAEIIKSHTYCNAPVIVPHDAKGKSDKAYQKLLRNYGVNSPTKEAHNPSITNGGGWSKDGIKVHEKSIEAGLWFMEDHFKRGKLKVVKTCTEWFKEKNGYFRTGKKPPNAFSGEDHAIDSSRYGFISALGGRGQRAGDCQKQGDTYEEVEYYDY